MNVRDLFKKHADEYLKFDKIENKLSSRKDLHAFILLAKRFDSTDDLICSAEHDKIWLNCDDDEIELLSEEEVIDMIICGVSHAPGMWLYMFV